MSDKLTFEIYNKNRLAVRGDRVLYNDLIKGIGGRWNSRMHGGEGWIISIDQKDILEDLINSLSDTQDNNELFNLDNDKPKKDIREYDDETREDEEIHKTREIQIREMKESEEQEKIREREKAEEQEKARQKEKAEEREKIREREKAEEREKSRQKEKAEEREKIREREKADEREKIREREKAEEREKIRKSEKAEEREKIREREKAEEREKIREREKAEEREKIREKESEERKRIREKERREFEEKEYILDKENRRKAAKNKPSKETKDIVEHAMSVESKDPLAYFRSFSKKPVDFRKLYGPSDSDKSAYSSSTSQSESSDDFPSPNTPINKRGSENNHKDLFDKVNELQRKLHEMEVKNRKLKAMIT